MPYSEKSFHIKASDGFYQVFYNDWGDQDLPPAICVPGLTGNGHDFDYLAQDLIKNNHRLAAIDLPGRGRSHFLNSTTDYNYDQYTLCLQSLLADLGYTRPASIDWIGISLGGLLGILLAGMKNSPIKRLIINDVGPAVPQEALDFIAEYVAQPYEFESVQDLEQRMRETRGLTWGPLDDEQWRHMAEHNARALENSKITYAYDPGIADIFKTEPIGAHDLWDCWDNIKCPVLLIRGGKSTILPVEIMQEMQSRGPGPDMDIVEFEDCGHVPSLMAPAHIQVIREWLEKS